MEWLEEEVLDVLLEDVLDEEKLVDEDEDDGELEEDVEEDDDVDDELLEAPEELELLDGTRPHFSAR